MNDQSQLSLVTSAEPRVSIIVLNWNGYEKTRACLESLYCSTYANTRVIIVDNGSIDGSAEKLQNDHPQAEILRNSTNLGFSRGCNVGIEKAIEDERCRYVLLINNDVTVSPEFLKPAITVAESSEEIGIVGGKLHDPVSRKVNYSGGYIDRFRAGWFRDSVLGRNENTVKCVGFVTGALMLIKRKVLDDIGPLSEDYFFGLEDVDYCLRARRAGYKILYVPDFVGSHSNHGSHGAFDIKFVYNGYRSRLIFQQKYLPPALFNAWLRAFVVFERHVQWRRLQKAFSGAGLHKSDLDFALRTAIEDHRERKSLDENSLHFFKARLRQRNLEALIET